MTISHLEEPDDQLTEKGNVKAGDVIGYSGVSGNSIRSNREPHAHLVTRQGNSLIDPLAFLSPTREEGLCEN